MNPFNMANKKVKASLEPYFMFSMLTLFFREKVSN